MPRRFIHERIENRPRAIAHRKKFPRLLALESHAHRREPLDRLFDGERAQDFRDRVAIAVETGGLDDVVRHVASPAAGDQDLRAESLRTVEGDDSRAILRRKDRGGQSRRAGADDGDVIHVREARAARCAPGAVRR